MITTAAAPAVITTPAAERDPAARTLGALAMLGAPGLLLASVAAGGGDWGVSVANTALQIAYLGGWACGAVGLRRLRATGRGRGAGVLLAVQLVGLALAVAASVWEYAVNGKEPAGGAARTAYFAIDIFWPASHVLMLVVAGAVLRAKVWRGWLAYAPLVCGLALPAFFAFSREAGGPIFPALVTAGFLAIGYGVFRGGGGHR